MELLAAFCVRQQINQNQICRVLECVSTEEALPILQESGKMQTVMDYIVERICYYMENRSGGRLKIDCILYANGYGELARSKEAEGWFTLLGQEQVQ